MSSFGNQSPPVKQREMSTSCRLKKTGHGRSLGVSELLFTANEWSVCDSVEEQKSGDKVTD